MSFICKPFQWLSGRAGVAILLAATLYVGVSPSAAAQETASGKVPMVSLAEITGTPGASLMVPLYFTPDPKTPLRSISVDVSYVANSLRFQKASLGAAAETAKVDIKTDVTEGQPDDKGVKRATLNVTATLSGQTPATGLPDGLLAYLLFEISLEAKPFAVKMATSVKSAEALSTPPKPVDVAQIGHEDGVVVVTALDVMPEATCFFFTH
jgi:hypothetical protein